LAVIANYLWKVTANRNNGKVTKGMSVEIMKSNTDSKPSQKEIAQALTNKYNTDVHESHCGQSNFDIIRINK
jgi:hypothetical protein